MKKKIAVIGGGVSGMVITVCLKNMLEDSVDIDLVSNDIGGEYANGGLKYIHFTGYVKSFFVHDLDITEYKTSKIIGAINIDKSIYCYPDYLWKLNYLGQYSDAVGIQKQYWDKTRQVKHSHYDSLFDKKCMNDPWNFNSDLKIEPVIGGLDAFIDILKQKTLISCNWIQSNVDHLVMDHIINTYDLIFYTIPINILLTYMQTNISVIYDSLSIYRFNTDHHYAGNKVWWDYLYLPDDEMKFHRVSKSQNSFDVETTHQENDIVVSQFTDFMKKYYDITNLELEFASNIKIKGHLNNALKPFNIPDKIITVGRYAEWNKRITLDKVIKRLFVDFSEDKITKILWGI